MSNAVTEGVWTSTTVDDPKYNPTGLGTDHVEWGVGTKSGYRFSGGSVPVKLDGTEFTLGTFTHENKPLDGGVTGREFDVHLKVAITFQDQVEHYFSFRFHHNETDDGPDFVTLDEFRSPETAMIDGEKYHVVISGFKQDGKITRRFVSPEDGSNSADIVAMFTAKNKKPRLEASVNRQGVNPGESDEYVELRNIGNAPLDLSGYTISGPNTDKKFTFPAGAELEAGDRIRVYTNETHPETGGYSFNSPEPIWLNADEGEETVRISPPR
ncbi:choice-of-anchor K domain-containing protein [Streptomyces sp. NPDC057002]|uniref:lamin tail domain-containing protein n=1 Tax=Streptomyces sp. NPDC057002 TaxID=3345992 RepID=UPI00362AD396